MADEHANSKDAQPQTNIENKTSAGSISEDSNLSETAVLNQTSVHISKGSIADEHHHHHHEDDQDIYYNFERYWGFFDAAIAILVTILPIKIFERVAEHAEEEEHEHVSPYTTDVLKSLFMSAPLAFFLIYYVWFRLARIFEDWHYAPIQVLGIIGGFSAILLQFPTATELYTHNHHNVQVRSNFYFILFETALYLQWCLYFSYNRNPRKYKCDWDAGWLEIGFTLVAFFFSIFIPDYNWIVILVLIISLPIIRSKIRQNFLETFFTGMAGNPLLQVRDSEERILSHPPPMKKMRSIEELEDELQRLENRLNNKKSILRDFSEGEQPIDLRQATVEGFRLPKERMDVFADAIYAIAAMVICLGLRSDLHHDEKVEDLMTKNSRRAAILSTMFYSLVSFWKMEQTILDTMFHDTISPFFVVVWGVNLFLISLTSATFGILCYTHEGKHRHHWEATVGHGINILLVQFSFYVIYRLAKLYGDIDAEVDPRVMWHSNVYNTCIGSGWILTILLIAIDPENLDTYGLIPIGPCLLVYICIIYGPIFWRWLKPRCHSRCRFNR